MKQDYFYSKSTGLYIARNPLTINSRTTNAAKRAKLKIDWDDEGRIINCNFDEARLLLESLNSKMLTPTKYWKALKDAVKEKDKDMIDSLTSNKFAEWLDRVYFINNTQIDRPKIVGKYKYAGKIEKSSHKTATPGWFNPKNNINYKTGNPINIELQRKKFSNFWKYWSPNLKFTYVGISAAVRGYVTSVGMPSFDLGIPVDSKEPKSMIRECKLSPETPKINKEIMQKYDKALKSENKIIAFVKNYGNLFSKSFETQIYKIREQIFDILGEISLSKDTANASEQICDIKNKNLEYKKFEKFIMNSKSRLKKAIRQKKDIIFVMGHKNPDTDSVISSLFEAYRNHLINSAMTHIPIIQAKIMPNECKYILKKISEHVISSDNLLYIKAKKSGLARWISVDQNTDSEVQKYFITIIDHHIVSETAKNKDIPKTLEMLGSSAALITRKYLGMGLKLDKQLSELLYCATLMDTENRVKHKMTKKDVLLMNYLKKISQIKDDNKCYSNMMSYLLNENNAKILFERDYKEDWGFGFAVAKIKGGFDKKSKLIRNLYKLADENTKKKNLPLTVIKITDYKNDNNTVNRERIYFSFNGLASQKFKKSSMDLIINIIKFEFPKNKIKIGKNHVDFEGEGLQLSRKKTAPVFEQIVMAFNEYFYSKSIKKWIKRDFFKKTKEVKEKSEGLSTDKNNRINYITYKEAKKLCKKLKINMLSLNEYFKALKDAKKTHDSQMIDSLQGSNFVEFLDSAIVKKKYLIDHPNEKFTNKKRKVSIPDGNPGLINPKEVNSSTGFPTKVYPANTYGTKELWRYWQPDSDFVIPCRSYIFLLDQPCLDGKFHLNDSFPNLGIRPVVKKRKEPKMKLSFDKKNLKVTIIKDKEEHIKKWPKDISKYNSSK